MNINEDFYYKVNEVNSLLCSSQIQVNNKSKYKRYNKYFRNRKHKDDSVRYVEIIKLSEYNWWTTDKYNWFNRIKVNSNYKLYSAPIQISKCRGYCKKSTNKIIRHSNNIGNYSGYKKYFDYWNEIF